MPREWASEREVVGQRSLSEWDSWRIGSRELSSASASTRPAGTGRTEQDCRIELSRRIWASKWGCSRCTGWCVCAFARRTSGLQANQFDSFENTSWTSNQISKYFPHEEWFLPPVEEEILSIALASLSTFVIGVFLAMTEGSRNTTE